MNKFILYVKKNYVWIIPCLCLIPFLVILEDVFESEIMECDVVAYSFFVNTLRSDWLTKVMNFVTNMGSASVLIGICVLTFLIVKNKKISLVMTINLGLVTLFNQLLKLIVQRPRPVGYNLIMEDGYSFPSGHSMVSLAFYGFLIYLIYRYVKRRWLRNVSCIFLGLLIILIGCSRIYLGVHYASDVIAGAFISLAYLTIFVHVISDFIEKRNINEE